MSTLFGTTASAVSATIDIINISKLSLNCQSQPSFGSPGSLILVLLVFLASCLLLLSKCTFPFANLFPFGCSDSMFCLFPKSGSSDTGDLDVFLITTSRYCLKELPKVFNASPKELARSEKFSCCCCCCNNIN